MLCLFSETNLPIQSNRLSLFPSLPPRYLEFSPRLKLLLLLAPGMTNKESYPGESAALDYGSVFHCLPPSLVFRSHDHRPQPRQSSLCASEAAAIADHRSCAQWNAGNSTERGVLFFPTPSLSGERLNMAIFGAILRDRVRRISISRKLITMHIR